MSISTAKPATIDSLGLERCGITAADTIHYNLSYEALFSHETQANLTGYEQGHLTTTDAVTIDTGRFTGRSPKDKYIVKHPDSEKNVWWADQGSDNKPINQEIWTHLNTLATTRLNGRTLYVMDGFCGASTDTRLSVRLVTEVAWQAHFFKNMFIWPS